MAWLRYLLNTLAVAAGLFLAVCVGYGIAFIVLQNGKEAIIGFMLALPVYGFVLLLGGAVFHRLKWRMPWTKAIWLITMALGLTEGAMFLWLGHL